MKRPVALTLATIWFFVVSVAFCGFVEVPEITSARHLLDIPIHLLVILVQIIIGIGLLRLDNWARVWAVFFFALSAFFTLFSLVMWWNHQADIALFQGMPASLQATVDFCGIIASVWSGWILCRKDIRTWFSTAVKSTPVT